MPEATRDRRWITRAYTVPSAVEKSSGAAAVTLVAAMFARTVALSLDFYHSGPGNASGKRRRWSAIRATATPFSDALMFELATIGFHRENGRNVVGLPPVFPSGR